MENTFLLNPPPPPPKAVLRLKGPKLNATYIRHFTELGDSSPKNLNKTYMNHSLPVNTKLDSIVTINITFTIIITIISRNDQVA